MLMPFGRLSRSTWTGLKNRAIVRYMRTCTASMGYLSRDLIAHNQSIITQTVVHIPRARRHPDLGLPEGYISRAGF